jgi:hypothetical protein
MGNMNRRGEDGLQVGFIIGGPQQSRKQIGENAPMLVGAARKAGDL